MHNHHCFTECLTQAAWLFQNQKSAQDKYFTSAKPVLSSNKAQVPHTCFCGSIPVDDRRSIMSLCWHSRSEIPWRMFSRLKERDNSSGKRIKFSVVLRSVKVASYIELRQRQRLRQWNEVIIECNVCLKNRLRVIICGKLPAQHRV